MKSSQYSQVVVESFQYHGGGSIHKIRCRPVAGQGLSTSMRVECSSQMRRKHPVGTKFLIEARVTDREGGTPFLYTSHTWPYKVLTDEEAERFIAEHHGS